MIPVVNPFTGEINFVKKPRITRIHTSSGVGQQWYGGSSLPSDGTLYQLFVNTTNNTLYYWNGSTWVALSGGSTPTTNNLLLEDGSYILLEDGSKLVLE